MCIKDASSGDCFIIIIWDLCVTSLRSICHFTIFSLYLPTKDTDDNGALPVQERRFPGFNTTSCPDSDPDSDITVDYTETHSPSPEHWALSATQDFSGATDR